MPNKDKGGARRKPIGEDNRLVTFYLPVRLIDLISTEAHKRNITVSSLLREAVEVGTSHILG